jgi:endoglucanase
MKIFLTIFLLFFVSGFNAWSQIHSKNIITDQFGYLPDSKKIAVIKNPQIGFDKTEQFTPGNSYSLVNAKTGKVVFSANPVSWKTGATDASSGDQVWHFDFSAVTEIGNYYVLDDEKQKRSYEFRISPSVYNEVLKHAMRSFFYQRSGFAKEAKYAGKAWADGASHIGKLQDKNCRLFSDKNNAATERDVSGGWYDAGDYNKYTNWTSNYVVEMMKAYLERPEAWADDYNIPESGNKIPDLLDEAKWGIDHLLRLQLKNGSVLSIVGESHLSPPSKATGQSVYGPASTSATLNTCAALAIASKVYRITGMTEYADTLKSRAIKAWKWAETNPKILFQNNDAAYNSVGLAAGGQETDDYGRLVAKLESACFLFEITGDAVYKTFFEANYLQVHLLVWNFAYPFEPTNQELLLYYAALSGATPAVANKIKSVYKNAILTGSDNMPAVTSKKDPYMAYIKEYTWGSNATKGAQGSMYYNLISYGIDPNSQNQAIDAAQGYLHYIHGVNPLNMVYLSNMYRYGAHNGVNEFYHSWFENGSALWDRVGKSTYGPAPGYLTGGPNPSYNWASCCPAGCGGVANNAICISESIDPPRNQPAQKSYKDFNTSWPINSWEVTENSCGYQVNYIRLLSKFVNLNYDCNGDLGGSASIDAIGKCAGGNTGVIPETDPDKYTGIEVELSDDIQHFDIFPNPSDGFLNVTINDPSSYSIRIFDVSGKIWMETCLSGNDLLDIRDLKPGIYGISFSSEFGKSTRKLIRK